MILLCDDFSFDGKSLKSQKYMTVNFDSDFSLPSSIVREMDSSSINQYRSEVNGFGIKYTETLIFDIHIGKNLCNATTQKDLEFTPDEYDDLVSWLSSPLHNKWLDIITNNQKKQKVKGYFSSITPYDGDTGICYGARCTFTCNSPFSYEEKSYSSSISGINNFLLNNTSSELYDYVYPTLQIEPTKNEDIFIHNMSDTEILNNGQMVVNSDASQNITTLQSKINEYAMTNNLTVSYMIDETTKDIKMICDQTGLLFYMTDSYGVKKKYVAYYLKSNGQYWICRSGFFYCKLSQALNLTIDCKNLGFYDSLNRPVLFDDIGIQDEDEIYWIRLIHSNNSFQVLGNFKLTITWLEPRKGLLI